MSNVSHLMRIHAFIVVLALLLQACGIPQSSTEFDKTPEAQYLKATISRLVARDYLSIESQMDERVHQPDARQALERLAATVPMGAPVKLEPVAWTFVNTTSFAAGGNSSRIANVAIEYTFPDSKWIVASATLSGEPGAFRILAFNVEPLPAPLAELNAFTFDGKGLSHYVFFLLTLCASGISVYAFARCIRTRGIRRKWLWAIFTLVGLVAFTINWSSGAVSVDALRFNLLSAGFVRAGWLGPWGITFCIPVGALVFLWRFRKRTSTPLTDG
jgi:hypothetical protein